MSRIFEKFRSLKNKMMLPIVLTIFVTITAVLLVVSRSTGELADSFINHRVDVTAAAVGARMDDLEEKTRLVALSVAADYAIVSNIQLWNTDEDSRDAARAAIIERAAFLSGELGIDSFVIRDREGRLVLRLHELDIYGDFGVGEVTPNLVAFEGGTQAGFISTATMPMGLATTTPISITYSNGEIIGTLSAIYMLNTEEFVDTFAEIFNARVSVFQGNMSIMSSARYSDGTRIIGVPLSDEAYEYVLMRGESFRQEINIPNEHDEAEHFIAYKLPLKGVDGSVLGAFIVAFSNSEAVIARSNLQRIIIGVGAIGMVVAVAIMFVLLSGFLRPLKTLRDNMKNGVTSGMGSKLPKDELGTIICEVEAIMLRERDAAEQFMVIFETAPLATTLYDKNFDTITHNKEVEEMYGTAFAMQNGDIKKSMPEFQPDGRASMDVFKNATDAAMKNGIHTEELLCRHKDGTIFPSEVTWTRVKYKGDDVLVEYTRDLTEIKAAEKKERELNERERVAADESNRAKSQFLARMSHEIRTPISAVMGIAEIELKSGGLSPHIEESFSKIHGAANILLGIVNDILDLSKIEAGKMDLMRTEYLVSSLIVDIAYLHIVFLNSRDITFNLTVDENLPTGLLGDSLRIMQVVNNLLSNAFKYTDSGMVDLHVKCLPADDGYVWLEISIRDTGFGMTEEQLAILRNSDYIRFHEHESRFIGGTGLGIPIVYSLLALMDADIKYESSPGVGTTVTVSIPQQIADATPIGKEFAERLQQFEEVILSSAERCFDVAPEPMPYGSVLVVDDVDANLYVSRGLMEFYELSIETCTGGKDAIEKVKSGKVYDIIFLDEMMPGMSGTETLRALREIGYTGTIVALTANALIGQAEEYYRAGFDSFISKPIQTKNLNAILVKFIRDKQPPEVLEAYSQNEDAGRDMERWQREISESLRPRFARSYRNTSDEFTQSLSSGDIETARRIAHTLKTSASLIHEYALSDAAYRIEYALLKGESPTDAQVTTFKTELLRTLDSIVPAEIIAPTGSKISAAELYEKLEPLLEKQSAAALNFTDALREIPEASELAQHIEDFNHNGAREALRNLMR
ncbi:MAG: ATP-binding protein [Defluviitaleaceae bacterium]|nr:ATP-binding protein [Defluviitaleaceae bacterium]